MPEVPDSQVGGSFIRNDELLVRDHVGQRCLLIRAKTNGAAFKALGDWVAEYGFCVWAVNVERNNGWELMVYYTRR